MSFFEKQWKLILGLCAAIFIIGAAVTAQVTMKLAQEKTVQENFFLIEKKYSDYKTKKNSPDETKTTKKDATPTSPADLSKNLDGIKKDLVQFIAANPGAKATQMAAIYYSEILKEEKNKDEALAVLQKVQNNDHGLVNTLVQQQIGQILADSEKCQEAINSWQKIVDRKDAAFLHNDVKIQQALCYQKLNDMKKAEELLTNIANQKPDGRAESPSIKEAARYLRLIQFKKVSGT